MESKMKTTKQIQSEYSKGIIVYCLFYAIALIASIYAIKHFNPPIYIKLALAILTSLPIGGTILVFLKFIRESDEFIRAKVTEAFIKATGLTLFMATLWGFAENYSVVSHLDYYLIYPIFWACFGLVQISNKVKDNEANS